MPGGAAGGRAGIETYLEYAQENIERSRMLFQKGDIRYAVFSANEGLELCVKAYMLRHGLIDRAEAAGHFPYPAAVRKMEEVTRSIIKGGPDDREELERALESLAALKAAFRMMAEKALQIPLWKSSLNMQLADDDEDRLDEFQEKMSAWGREIDMIAAEATQSLHEQDAVGYQPGVLSKPHASTLGSRQGASGRREGARSGQAPGGENVPPGRVSKVELLFPLAPLFLFLDIIPLSFAHQQISRYPTQIDGVDSRTAYARNRGAVKDLLENIYRTSELLSNHLKHGHPLWVRHAAGAGDGMRQAG